MDTFIISTFLIALLAAVTSHPTESNDMINPLDMRTFTMPESCKSKGINYCFDKTGYPTDIIQELLKDMDTLRTFESDDLNRGHSEQERKSHISICETTMTTGPIYFIVDKSGKDRVVVQMKDKFEQHFSVKSCDNEGVINTNAPHFLENIIKKYELYCENKYLNYSFLVLGLQPDFRGQWKMESVTTKTGIPVCCACRYKQSNRGNTKNNV